MEYSVCHGSGEDCSDRSVISWEQRTIVDKIRIADYDAFCQQYEGGTSICDLSNHKCTKKEKDCSSWVLGNAHRKTRNLYQSVYGRPVHYTPKTSMMNSHSAPTIRTVSAVAAPKKKIVKAAPKITTTAYPAFALIRKRAMSNPKEPVIVETTTTPAPRVWTTTSDVRDACGLHSAIRANPSARQSGSYFLLIRELRACLNSLRISNGDALWTLHNLRFGVAETYSFTDIMTDSVASVHKNERGHCVHSVQVDLVAEIDQMIAAYQSAIDPAKLDEYMKAAQPAYAFHLSLAILMNRLHDAHTMYSMPFDMFKVYAPISFGSAMKEVDGEQKQIITLRMHLPNENTDPFSKLIHMYRQVHGMDEARLKVEGVGIPEWYAGEEVTMINDIPALDFLLSLVADGGPFGGLFTQAEQRLNAFIFSVPVLSFSPLLGPLPLFDSLNIRMHDMNKADTPYKVKLMGHFMDQSELGVPNLRSKESLEKYIHNNDVFNSFVKLDTNTQGDVNSLWVAASAAATANEKKKVQKPLNLLELEWAKKAVTEWIATGIKKVTTASAAAAEATAAKRHKRFTDPVTNAIRDNILVAAMIDMDDEETVQNALRGISEKTPPSSPRKISRQNSFCSPVQNVRMATSPIRSPAAGLTHSDRYPSFRLGSVASTQGSRKRPSSAGMSRTAGRPPTADPPILWIDSDLKKSLNIPFIRPARNAGVVQSDVILPLKRAVDKILCGLESPSRVGSSKGTHSRPSSAGTSRRADKPPIADQLSRSVTFDFESSLNDDFPLLRIARKVDLSQSYSFIAYRHDNSPCGAKTLLGKSSKGIRARPSSAGMSLVSGRPPLGAQSSRSISFDVERSADASRPFSTTGIATNSYGAGWNAVSDVFTAREFLCVDIRETPRVAQSPVSFTVIDNLEYLIKDDTMIVRVPSMNPIDKGHANFEMFPEMVAIQKRAKEGRVDRILFDVTGNAGGLVVAAYALQWYITSNPKEICAPLSKRISGHWDLWIKSFGGGLDELLNKHMGTKGAGLASKLNSIFDQIEAITVLIYDGLGLSRAQIGPTTKGGALARVALKRAEIATMTTDEEKSAAIIAYIRSRKFLPPNMPNNGEDLLPLDGFEPFSPVEMRHWDETHDADMYMSYELKQWGAQEGKYSKKTVFKFCDQVIQKMPDIAQGYEHKYWKEVGFVSDGTCGSACALFLQGIQLHGGAIGFTYGGLANTAMDVGSFAGGNVETYDEFWPKLTLAAKVAHLASLGETEWSQQHVNSWVATPVAFPTKAKVKFNWNMMFAPALGEDALPRQFYLIPPRQHLNYWAATRFEREPIYDEIAAIEVWQDIEHQFD